MAPEGLVERPLREIVPLAGPLREIVAGPLRG